MIEIWVPTREKFDCEYQVSNTGKIRSVKNGTMKQFSMKNGYLAIVLRKNKKTVCRTTHSLILNSFNCSKPTSKHQAAHTDGNKKNNHISNLSWKTCKENHADKRIHGTDIGGERNPKAALTYEQVKFIRKYSKKAKASWFAEKFNVSYSTIRNIIIGKTWKYHD